MTHELTGIFILVVAMAVESGAQIFLKIGATGKAGFPLPADPHPMGRLQAGAPAGVWVGLGMGAYLVEILLYTVALHFLDVSVAFPLGSLCFVGVAILSRLLLGEAVGPARWMGIGCIVAGAVFVTM